MTVHESVLEAIGDTPLVRLRQVTRGLQPAIYAKLEFTNPGGSIKDRAALAMVLDAERTGALRQGGTIVEATSGNTGIGLAVIAAQRGYRSVFVVPDKTSTEKIALLEAYGAQVVITPGGLPRQDPEHVQNLARRIADSTRGGWFADQYDNPANPQAHRIGTGPEIWAQTQGRVTHLVVGVGTGGTVTGTGEFLKQASQGRVQVLAADPPSSTYAGGDGSPYFVESIGHYRHPDTDQDPWPLSYQPSVVDELVPVGDRESLLTARRLAREEGLLVGGSSGTAVAAALQVAKRLGPDDLLVVVLPDSGRSYLSKYFNDGWLRAWGFLEDYDPAVAAGSVRAVAQAAYGAEWPALPTVPDDAPVGQVLAWLRSGRDALPGQSGGSAVAVVLHGRGPSSHGERAAPPRASAPPGTSAPEVLGVVRFEELAAALASGWLALEAPVGAAVCGAPPTAGVGEQAEAVLARLPADGPDLVPVVQDGRAVSAVTRSQLQLVAARSRLLTTP
jgi:cystathionine beta-synthase